MNRDIHSIDSAARLHEAVIKLGVLPFFKNTIEGWSVEELTPELHWFGDENSGGSLGPWDWKIDVIREGDVIYGKFFQRKAVFMTEEWFRHLMNYRRNDHFYQMATSGTYVPKNQADRLMKYLSPTLLSYIQKNGTVETGSIKKYLTDNVPESIRAKVGGAMNKYLFPTVKKQAIDSLVQYLQMGTWIVTSDFERVRRGTDLQYSGWQRSYLSSAELILSPAATPSDEPSWVRMFREQTKDDELNIPVSECSPEESYLNLRNQVAEITGEQDIRKLDKILK